jgi:hypothetical protein
MLAYGAGEQRFAAVSSRIMAFALGLLLWIAPAHAERRVALVIGNAAYQSATPLRTPVSDAVAVAETLRSGPARRRRRDQERVLERHPRLRGTR